MTIDDNKLAIVITIVSICLFLIPRVLKRQMKPYYEMLDKLEATKRSLFPWQMIVGGRQVLANSPSAALGSWLICKGINIGPDNPSFLAAVIGAIEQRVGDQVAYLDVAWDNPAFEPECERLLRILLFRREISDLRIEVENEGD